MSSDYPLVIYVPRAAPIPGQGITEPDWTDVLERIDDLEDGLALGELNDVDTAGITDGQTVIYDSTANGGAGGYVPGDPSGAISTVGTAGGSVYADVSELYFFEGLQAVETEPGEVFVRPVYAGTGSATTVARSDHSHTAQLISRTTGAATGVLSSGTRVLRNASGPALANGITYDVVGVFKVRARNNVDSGTVNLICSIGTGSTETRNVQTVGGVPVDQDTDYSITIVGTGAAVNEYFAVQHSTGSVTDLRDHRVRIEYRPRR